ncbi:MAG: pseudouridine synthase [Chloroflexi bacterium]|nr:pseudouridine synthase [Chloroflexota bacterium]
MAVNNSLVKYLVSAGIGSRRRSASLIMEGQVFVNGSQILNLNYAVDPRDSIKVNGLKLEKPVNEKIYILLNKPRGYLSAVNDQRGRQTILDLVPKNLRFPGLVPAGRLDLYSSGLMVLSNDGEFVNKITHPRYEVEKEYEVLLDATLSETDKKKLVKGIMIESGIAKIQSIRGKSPSSPQYNLILIEGKKREIRLLMSALGRNVRRLKRIRIGNFELGELSVGSVQRISEQEVKLFKKRL